MARKVISRRDLRRESEAAERAGAETKAATKAKAPAKKATARTATGETKRKSRAKTAREVRLKAGWGVFNQTMKRVALFNYSDRKQADKKAQELTASQKSPHFVQLVKEVIEE